MKKLIDANALKERKFPNGESEYITGWNDAISAIMTFQPTVDAEPVRHGKNVGTDYDETDQFVCSECGIELQGWYRVERDEDDGEETYHEYRLRYCPQCGTRIDSK